VVGTEFNTISDEVREIRRVVSKLERDKSEIDKDLMKLRNNVIEEVVPVNVDELKNSIKEIEEEINNHKKNSEEKKHKIKSIYLEIEPLDKELKEFESLKEEKLQESNSHQQSLDKLNTVVTNAQDFCERYNAAITSLDSQIEEKKKH